MSERTSPDLDLTLHVLNFATRVLASELDSERLVDRALDTLADFGRGRRVALLRTAEEHTDLEVAGLLSRGGLTGSDRRVPIEGTPFAEVVGKRQPRIYRLDGDPELPLPAPGDPDAAGECHVIPLIGSHNRVLGAITLDRAAGDPLSELDQQALTVIATLIAVSLENARLFKLATVDGLTGLYVRRYFQIRMAEECARIRRHGGSVALLMTDIDHFKQFNDRYGHQQGDRVLKEMADLCRDALRMGLDIPCRYGGEEFVIILPATDLRGACEVGERLRSTAARHPFSGQAKPLQVHLSVGIAAIDEDTLVEEAELVRRADEALYRAKDSGRNRVCWWEADA